DDAQRPCALADRPALGVREQPVPDTAALVPRSDEQLFDRDRPVLPVVAQRHVPRGLGLLAGDEDEILLEHLEHALVAPARHLGEGRPGEAEQEAELAGLRFADLHPARMPRTGGARGTERPNLRPKIRQAVPASAAVDTAISTRARISSTGIR